MRLAVALLTGLSLIGVACGGGSSGGGASSDDDLGDAQGLWLLTSLEVDGEPFEHDRPIFLEIDGLEVGGNTTCNDFGGTFGGEFTQTTAGCDEPLQSLERRMIELIIAGPPSVEDGELVFDSSSARLVYSATVDPEPEQLYRVLTDDGRATTTDEIFLDPEAGEHQDFDRLVRIEHPGTDARFYIGVVDQLVCFVVTTETASSTGCHQPRFAARLTRAMELGSRDGPVGVRSAVIPDRFVAAIEARPELGEMSANVLLVRDDAPPGRHTVVVGDDEFILDIV